jgi:hypothetical protein
MTDVLRMAITDPKWSLGMRLYRANSHRPKSLQTFGGWHAGRHTGGGGGIGRHMVPTQRWPSPQGGLQPMQTLLAHVCGAWHAGRQTLVPSRKAMSNATIVAPALSLISNERTPGSAASERTNDNLIAARSPRRSSDLKRRRWGECRSGSFEPRRDRTCPAR